MDADTKLQVYRTIDKLDRLGPDAVRELLTTGRRDASGAWTPGCGLTEDQADLLLWAVKREATDAATLRRLALFGHVMNMDLPS